MDPLSPATAALLLATGMSAGFVDAIAGGGGLLTLPALLWSGLPPAFALGTNKLQGSFGTLTASWRFWRQGLVDPHTMGPVILCTLCGAILGALSVQQLEADLLAGLIPFLLIAFAVYFLCSPRVSNQDAQGRIGEAAFASTAGSGIGFYDGFFGPGTGSFFVIGYVALLGYNLRRATAHTKVLNFTSNLASLVTFVIGGKVVWGIGLIMALGQFGGAWLGSHLAVRHGARLIRPLLVLVSVAISLKLLLA